MKTYYFYNECQCDENGFDDVWSHPDTLIIENPDGDTIKNLQLEYDFYDIDEK